MRIDVNLKTYIPLFNLINHHKIWQREETYLAMRSRIQWLREGDKNTKFFHATTIQRRQRNRISMLKDEHLGWIRDSTQLKCITQTYFEQLYRSIGFRDYQPVLTQCHQVIIADMNAILTAVVTREEVKQAAFQLGANKAPGPDGFNGLFFHNHWDIIHDDIYTSVNNFFNSGVMPSTFNRTLITLIPKVPHPERLEQY